MATDPSPNASGTPGVRPARRADLPRIARSLGRAFSDDPVWRHAVRRHDRFEDRIGSIMGLVAHLHLADHGTVWVGEDGAATAVWAPPGHWRLPPTRFVRHVPTLLRAAGLRSVPHLRILGEMERRHPDHDDHWYLAVLGTDPEVQGRGLGSAVLRPVLDRCDRDLLGAYLESSKPENVPFYERHGFRVIETFRAGRVGPPISTMWRDPRPGP